MKNCLKLKPLELLQLIGGVLGGMWLSENHYPWYIWWTVMLIGMWKPAQNLKERIGKEMEEEECLTREAQKESGGE